MEMRKEMTLAEMFNSIEESDYDKLREIGKSVNKKEIMEGGFFVVNYATVYTNVFQSEKISNPQEILMIHLKTPARIAVKNKKRALYTFFTKISNVTKISENDFKNYFNQKYFAAGKEEKPPIEKPVVKTSQETPQGEFKGAMLDNGTKTLAAIENTNTILKTAFAKANSISEKMQIQMYEMMKVQTESLKELLKVQEENRALLEKIHDGWFTKPTNEEGK